MLWKALDVESHFLLHCKKMNIKDKVIKSLSKILTQITEIGEKIKVILTPSTPQYDWTKTVLL